MREVGDLDTRASDHPAHVMHLVVRKSQELIQQAKPVYELEYRWIHSRVLRGHASGFNATAKSPRRIRRGMNRSS